MLEDKQFEWDNIVAGNWVTISEKQFEMLDNNVNISESQNYPTNITMDQVVSRFTMRATAEEKNF
ncbi:hypothetical protein SAMN05216389_10666 [Oceanobacillus limi]|uniref:Uncharacterized protein n=2 Tax=Oceanobacillus limi TaxID=930131 RepID=A0A1I0C8S6_9BACI|nr:hypothetical protein SAMN05216389_10666 [Oceanobacillus limi]